MERNEILKAIKSLAASQGFYGRLYNKLIDGSDASEEILNKLEEQNFSDVVDMIMWLES